MELRDRIPLHPRLHQLLEHKRDDKIGDIITATFICVPNTRMDVKWFSVAQQSLIADSELISMESKREQTEKGESIVIATLSFHFFTREDAGTYKIFCRNELGMTEVTFKIVLGLDFCVYIVEESVSPEAAFPSHIVHPTIIDGAASVPRSHLIPKGHRWIQRGETTRHPVTMYTATGSKQLKLEEEQMVDNYFLQYFKVHYPKLYEEMEEETALANPEKIATNIFSLEDLQFMSRRCPFEMKVALVNAYSAGDSLQFGRLFRAIQGRRIKEEKKSQKDDGGMEIDRIRRIRFADDTKEEKTKKKKEDRFSGSMKDDAEKRIARWKEFYGSVPEEKVRNRKVTLQSRMMTVQGSRTFVDYFPNDEGRKVGIRPFKAGDSKVYWDNGTLEIICYINAVPYPTVTWEADGVEIESRFCKNPRTNYFILSLPMQKTEDIPKYVVSKARNHFGACTIKVWLDFNEHPMIKLTTEPNILFGIEEKKITLFAKVQIPTDQKYFGLKWYHGGKRLLSDQEGYESRITRMADGSVEIRLVIEEPEDGEELWDCVMVCRKTRNEPFCDPFKLEWIVKLPFPKNAPKVVAAPDCYMKLVKGDGKEEPESLTCYMTVPCENVSECWWYNPMNKEMIQGERITISLPAMRNHHIAILEIRKVRPPDSGVYICRMVNSEGFAIHVRFGIITTSEGGTDVHYHGNSECTSFAPPIGKAPRPKNSTENVIIPGEIDEDCFLAELNNQKLLEQRHDMRQWKDAFEEEVNEREKHKEMIKRRIASNVEKLRKLRADRKKENRRKTKQVFSDSENEMEVSEEGIGNNETRQDSSTQTEPTN